MIRRAAWAGVTAAILSTGANACVCAPDITSAFSATSAFIADTNVRPLHQNITGKLIPAINDNTETVKKQTEQIRLLIKAEKLKAIQYRKILFLLEKKKRLNLE